MKHHLIVGLLTLFVLAPVVEVFSAGKDAGALTPEERESLGVQQPSLVVDFPFAPNHSVVGLTFILWVTDRTGGGLSLTFTTFPSGQTSIARTLTIGPGIIAPVGPADVNCPAEQVCRLVVTTPGATPSFDAVLQILTTAGTSVGFLYPSFYFSTQ